MINSNLEVIVAVAGRDMAIGRGGDLLYHLSPDLRHFKEITTGHTVIMGRRTFESLPKGALPNRRNIVLSRNAGYTAPGAEVFASLEEAQSHLPPAEKAFVIGGGTLYAQAIDAAEVIHLTEIDAEPEDADTFFPHFDRDDFVVRDTTAWLHDEKSGLDYRFTTLVRREKEKKSMADLHRIDIESFHQKAKLPLTLVLDDIRSLNNIGSIFRTADAFAIERLVLCGITATPPSAQIHKTALGAELSVDWIYRPSAAEAVKELKALGYVTAALEQVKESVDLFAFKPEKLNQKYAVVVGNEVGGVSQEAVNACDFCLEIPQEGTKHSLNVAVSAALAMASFYKSLNY